MEQELQKPTYTKLWARKMRNVFRGLDHEKMGYLTDDYLWSSYQKFIEVNPEVDEAKYREQHRHTWNVLFNNGKQVPKDHQLNEETFLKNMWVSVNQPDFKEMVQTMVKEGMESLDVEHKGYITREEYVGKLARHVGVEHATAVYNAMDTDSKGKIEYDDLFRAKLFYYTDLSDEANPLNLMQGPLE